MPELPEVETIRRSLEPHVVGRAITRVEVRERRLRHKVSPNFEEQLRGARIVALQRRGKYLIFQLDRPVVLLVHFGMSGSLELRDAHAPVEAHDHIRIGLGQRALIFNDPRRFGLMRAGPIDSFEELKNVAADPLVEPWSAERLRAVVRRRKLPIKNLLMDQRLIGGIGNIYANEMLFAAGIRPQRAACRLAYRELVALSKAMKEVLEEAVRQGGSSISDFRDGNGRAGYFQLHLNVYDRAGEPCRRCNSAIRRLVLSGRSSFYCPNCQR